MLTMSNINTIRNLRNNHDKSINHIAKELNVNWRTAKIVIQRQSEFMTSIEFLLEGVTKLHINNDLHATLEIFKAKFFKKNDLFYWFENDDDENSTNFVCETIRWRII